MSEPGGEGVREREEQREADTDHGDRVDERRDDEHLHLQHRGQLRLTRGAFEEATTENTEADSRAERAQTENNADGENRHGLNVCEISHFNPPREDVYEIGVFLTSVVLVRHR